MLNVCRDEREKKVKHTKFWPFQHSRFFLFFLLPHATLERGIKEIRQLSGDVLRYRPRTNADLCFGLLRKLYRFENLRLAQISRHTNTKRFNFN